MEILVRCAGEIIIKSDPVRRKFQNRLYKNCRVAFAEHRIKATLEPAWSRFFIQTEDPAVVDVLKRIYGVHNFAIIDRRCLARLDQIVDACRTLYSEKIKGKSFAVRCRRTGRHDFSSIDVGIQVGAAVNAHFLATVDLRNPEFEIFVDVSDNDVLIYSDNVYRGAGGLPLKTGGQAVCLMSGGFDSPLAAWMIQKRGVALDFVFANLAGQSYERSVLMVTKELVDRWTYGGNPRIHILDFSGLVTAIRKFVRPNFSQVVLKRLLYIAADRIAEEVSADAIVTGEAIGQVSSQTLRNLRAIEGCTDRPILRPLVAWDKEDIIQRCRQIGTYDLSAVIKEFCQLVPNRPVTGTKRRQVDIEYNKIPSEILDEVVSQRRVVAIKGLTQADLAMPYLCKDEIPEGATVIDCRSQSEFDHWHMEGAICHDFQSLMHERPSLDKDLTYMLCCEFGTQSIVVAEHLQSLGFAAYSLKGGLRSINASRH